MLAMGCANLQWPHLYLGTHPLSLQDAGVVVYQIDKCYSKHLAKQNPTTHLALFEDTTALKTSPVAFLRGQTPFAPSTLDYPNDSKLVSI